MISRINSTFFQIFQSTVFFFTSVFYLINPHGQEVEKVFWMSSEISDKLFPQKKKRSRHQNHSYLRNIAIQMIQIGSDEKKSFKTFQWKLFFLLQFKYVLEANLFSCTYKGIYKNRVMNNRIFVKFPLFRNENKEIQSGKI